MTRLRIVLPSVWLVLLATASFAQPDFSQAEITTTPVAGNVYMLHQSWVGNVGVSVGPDGILIVDDQMAPLSGKIRAALAELGEGKLEFVLNTHWHEDHTGGNAVFGAEAPIIAHTNVRARLSTEQKVLGRTVQPAPDEALPVVTFDESLSIHFNGEEIKAIHLPHGHTDGDIIVYFTGSNVVHMGDDLFTGMFPFVDLDSGGDVEGLIHNIDKVITMLPADVKIIPGHGQVSTLEDLKQYRRMLVETSQSVRSRIEAGKSLKEIQAEGLPEIWKDWAWEFISEELWIQILYRSLQQGTGDS